MLLPSLGLIFAASVILGGIMAYIYLERRHVARERLLARQWQQYEIAMAEYDTSRRLREATLTAMNALLSETRNRNRSNAVSDDPTDHGR